MIFPSVALNHKYPSCPKFLLIGSCLSEILALRIRAILKKEKRDPDILHHILVNHLSTLYLERDSSCCVVPLERRLVCE